MNSEQKYSGYPQRLEDSLSEYELVIITSPLTDLGRSGMLLEDSPYNWCILQYGMGSSNSREEFNAICKTAGQKSLPLIFYKGEFIGGLLELERFLGLYTDKAINNKPGEYNTRILH